MSLKRFASLRPGVVPATARSRSATSAVSHNSGFELAALQLSAELGIPTVLRAPDQAITTDNIDVDVFVVLGADRLGAG